MKAVGATRMEKERFIRKRRCVAGGLSVAISTVYLGYLAFLSVAPQSVEGRTMILAGFGIIVLSVISTAAYGVWSTAMEAQLRDGDE